MYEFASLDLGFVPIPVVSLICGLIIFSVGVVSGSDWMATRRKREEPFRFDKRAGHA